LAARYHPVTPTEDPVLRALLAALGGLDPATDALVATLTWRQGEVWLTTPPAGARPPVSVRLGRDDFAGRLRRLRLFWDRAVLTRPEQDFALIDLRFAGQIVTQEAVRAP
ncbi:MAG: cell division protein FtsQ/DivIB, partial [Rhodothermales bacterium]|nr:cell division protein FtsQ/DivIB [Rhodothermales bacterium]